MLSVSLVCIFVLTLVIRKVAMSRSVGTQRSISVGDTKIVHKEDIGFFDKLSLKTQSTISSAFVWWAKNVVCRSTFSAIVTVIVSLGWIIGLAYGLKWIEFTTDPIRLWASESSDSFIEYTKEHFNKLI